MTYIPATSWDISQVTKQLGRNPRGMVGIGASAGKNNPLGVPEGEILVVVTAPRVQARKSVASSSNDQKIMLEPFPTTFYLTHPTYTATISRLEANGLMKELENKLQSDADLRSKYELAHKKYIEFRDTLAKHLNLEPLKTHQDFSAGGMPNRVKCLHALVGHSLSTMYDDGTSENPIGDIVLKMLQDE